MGDATILLRLIVNVPAVAARALVPAFAGRLEGAAVLARCTVEPYEKLPGHHEVALYLCPTGDARRVYAALLALAPTGWTHGPPPDAPGSWAVWNPTGDAVFLLPAVRWAELQLLDEPLVGDEQAAGPADHTRRAMGMDTGTVGAGETGCHIPLGSREDTP